MRKIIRKIIKLHNSLSMTIPSEFVKKLDLKKGEYLNLRLYDNKIVIKK